ncbi:coiled-coil domain-containing protein 93-like isoform X1 [Zingiber officinale]|uniref:coiled-coil domain-containing protein 93-like isoform X1 n=1 Tax=Zingiber officinale TaxID=94328 RepID=UPI001C4AC1A2|nr:coiled-coil domain-containing protein 93-like isoform X1 [Zingiber officinale]
MDVEGSIEYQQQQLELDDFDHTLSQVMDKMVSSKQELAAKLRMILSVKRKIDDVPTQAELIQYERRLSELYSQIRDKHKQTSTLFDTYNSLLEIKELMLKETSILNSINSQVCPRRRYDQFQDALTSTIGRTKLVDSLETIVKGARQKLEKVELSLMAEKKNSESLREKLTTNLADQRYFSSLLKELQEECAKNERIRQAE